MTRCGEKIGRVVATALLMLAWSGDTSAHERSESFSHWRYHDGVLSLRFTVSAREAARISAGSGGAQPGPDLARYLDSRIDVRDPADSCRREGRFHPLEARPGYLQAAAHWRCDEAPARLAVTAFFDLAAEHAHFATLALPGATTQKLLTRERPVWSIAADEVADSAGTDQFGTFVTRGFRHILSGPDHVLFLLVLLLACRRASAVFWAITGFTLGHSLTLGLAAMGVLEPRLPAVEATIGLTIAVVAAERAVHGTRHAALLPAVFAALLLLLVPVSHYLHGPAPQLLAALALFVFCYLLLARSAVGNGAFRVAVTALFGLVHGLGFAAAFVASELQPNQLWRPLAGFNVGVELGQLAVVGLMALIAVALRKWPRLASLSAEFAAAAGCAVGLYWFVQRGFA